MKKRITFRLSTIISSVGGQTIAQVVSRRFLSAEARVRFQANPCGIRDGQGGIGKDVSSNTSVFPVRVIPRKLHTN
jgi:hypothetical protein